MHAVRKRRQLTITPLRRLRSVGRPRSRFASSESPTDPPHWAHVALSVFRERVYMLNTAPSRPATAKQGDLDRRIKIFQQPV